MFGNCEGKRDQEKYTVGCVGYLWHYSLFLHLKTTTQVQDSDFFLSAHKSFPDEEFCFSILVLFWVTDQHQPLLVSGGTEPRSLVVSLLSITVLSLALFLFMIQKRKITQSMICQNEIHFTTHPLELQWNCKISLQQYLIDGLWRLDKKVNKVSFLTNVFSAAFSYLPCGIFGNFSHSTQPSWLITCSSLK